MPELSKRCIDRLSECHFDIQAVIVKTSSYLPIMVTWGWRGKEDQEEAYHGGKSSLRWPHSKHNRMVDGVPQSHAVDIIPFALGEDIVWDVTDKWRLMASYVWQVSIKKEVDLIWGGYFGDYSHFEKQEKT